MQRKKTCVKSLYHLSALIADIYQHPTVPTHCCCASFQDTMGKMIFSICSHWTHTDTRNSQTQCLCHCHSCQVLVCMCFISFTTISSQSLLSAACVCRYVERKNFLERVDLRQFELEKSVRLNNMKRWQEERADTFTDHNTDCPIFTFSLHILSVCIVI